MNPEQKCKYAIKNEDRRYSEGDGLSHGLDEPVLHGKPWHQQDQHKTKSRQFEPQRRQQLRIKQYQRSDKQEFQPVYR